jgi:CubicO group peptidase (beta-lactamase class C family)
MPFPCPLLRLLLGLSAAGLAGCTSTPPGRALQVASASTSQTLCAAVFVSHRDPDQAYREESRPTGGMGLVAWALRYEVDRDRREVRSSLAGAYPSRSVYREGMGCLLDHGDIPPTVDPAVLAQGPAGVPDIAGPGGVEPADPRLVAALDEAFREPSEGPLRQTKAVVVLHRGRVVAERYAPDVGLDTVWHGHSVSKAVTHALVGVLVRQGRLDPAPLEPWLRMTEGKARFRGYDGFDDATRMWSTERDMAGYAASRPQVVPPGTRWVYSDGAYMRVSRAVRDAAGGRADDVLRLAHGQLFGPLGMKSVVMEFDATGTPVGASHFYATARDWARFGQLYLADGMAGPLRVLPEGWVKHATTPTLDAGYGAGWWLNLPVAEPDALGFPWGLPGAPADAFFGFGYLGQFVVVVPSRQLVVVRLGLTHEAGGDRAGVGRLIAQVAEAVAAPVQAQGRRAMRGSRTGERSPAAR